MSARPLAASVQPLALGYDERSTQANVRHVENPGRGRTLRAGYPTIATHLAQHADAASAQQELHWCVEVASKMGILSVATSSSRRTDPT